MSQAGLQPVTTLAMLVSKGCAAGSVRLIWVVSTVKWDHGIVQIRAVAEGHVWVHDPALSRVCVDVCDS